MKKIPFLFLSVLCMMILSGCAQKNNTATNNESYNSKNSGSPTFIMTPENTTYDRHAYFEFSGSGNIECRLNDKVFSNCSSPIFFSDVNEGKNTFIIRDSVSNQEVVHEWETLDIFKSNTPDLLQSNQQPSKAEPRSWRGIIRINCDFSHSSYNDPIIYPNQENKAHLHNFYGKEGVDHKTDTQNLITTGTSTCQGNQLNRTSYWVPALLAPKYDNQGNKLYDGDGNPEWHTVSAVVGTNEEAHEVFYYSASVDDLESIQPIPVGLKMIAGDPSATVENTQDTSIVRWHCQSWESTDAGNPRWSTTIPDCKAPDRVRMDIFFPSCWDGKNLDSSDHKSHMAYPIKQNGKNVCPASHPTPLVRPSYHFAFGVKPNVYNPTTKSSLGWRLASDSYTVTEQYPGGASLHGDWINGWHPSIMDTMLEICIKKGYDCHNGNLANGWRLSEAKKGIQNETPIIHNGLGIFHAKH